MTYEKASARGQMEYGGGGYIEPPAARPTPSVKTGSVSEGDEIFGIGCRYGVIHRSIKGRTECFVQGCFARTLASQQAVRLLLDHDESKLIATSADDLVIESDDRELRIRCPVRDTSAGRMIKSAVKHDGRVEMSVGYHIVESFERDVEGKTITFITDAMLLEISAVIVGAVPGTSASIRSSSDDPLIKSLNLLGDAMAEKNRALRLLLDSL
ncbi:MAG: HK97 family phage prohead protease [Mesorhizobium sp.]|uniref:HK97 family phage prohead protease n=1 Tax=unclassified Mesorhizobium TaxID=325217 RepID=UPI000FEA966E|nr:MULTISPECIES: HK97 family phage prohead protease [unclassified Mesorhizobium]RWC17048.1 MAG: HK97 family phage prohead protease [Mesorhizobium sp.]TGU01264.1 HK97 family phage prohead protease [Mesorhizobium sp. M5C.F.Ca.ET.164.01.1.1]